MKRAGLLAPFALLLLAAQEPLPPEQETEHLVLPGETLGGVAIRAQVPRILIIEANGLKSPYHLRAGQKLKIPRTRHHTVIRGETGFTIAYTYAVPWRDIAMANAIEPDAALKPGQKLLIPTVLPQVSGATPSATPTPMVAAPQFAWPLATRQIRRGFSPRGKTSHHDGLDLTVPAGHAVRASAAGKVIFAGHEPSQFGNLVVIEHDGGWQSAYAFLSRITVKDGEEVNQDERIGLSGRTGLSRGPELHFELRRDNRPVDPAGLLPARD